VSIRATARLWHAASAMMADKLVQIVVPLPKPLWFGDMTLLSSRVRVADSAWRTAMQ
jgi:hypothetical protein